MHIQTVGLRGLKAPVLVKEKGGQLQHTIAEISLRASLSEGSRDNCVDILIAVLEKHINELSVTSFSRILSRLQDALQAKSVRLEMTFPYFIDKRAPVSGTHSLMEYSCTFSGGIGDDDSFILSVVVPVTTLCPCSKEISAGGAHNQRAEVTLNVTFKNFIWVEDLISLVEGSASCELYALLKRPDEKYVTEKAFNNPMFVEDVVRKVAVRAMADPNITWFSAGVESFESIHKHSAYAYVDSREIG